MEPVCLIEGDNGPSGGDSTEFSQDLLSFGLVIDMLEKPYGKKDANSIIL